MSKVKEPADIAYPRTDVQQEIVGLCLARHRCRKLKLTLTRKSPVNRPELFMFVEMELGGELLFPAPAAAPIARATQRTKRRDAR